MPVRLRQDSRTGKLRMGPLWEDNRKWGTICDADCSEAEFESAYKEQADYLKQWLTVRFEWLKKEFDAM